MADGYEPRPLSNGMISFQSIIAPMGTSDTFTVPNSYRGVLFILDSTYENMCCFMVSSTGAGVVHCKPIISSTAVQVSIATNSVTFSHGQHGFLYFIINANYSDLVKQ